MKHLPILIAILALFVILGITYAMNTPRGREKRVERCVKRLGSEKKTLEELIKVYEKCGGK